MTLKFRVDQAEAFRRGIDCPEPIVTINVNPSHIPQRHRGLIAARLSWNNDVCRLFPTEDGLGTFDAPSDEFCGEGDWPPQEPLYIIAKLLTYEGLIEAVEANQKELEAKRTAPQ